MIFVKFLCQRLLWGSLWTKNKPVRWCGMTSRRRRRQRKNHSSKDSVWVLDLRSHNMFLSISQGRFLSLNTDLCDGMNLSCWQPWQLVWFIFPGDKVSSHGPKPRFSLTISRLSRRSRQLPLVNDSWLTNFALLSYFLFDDICISVSKNNFQMNFSFTITVLQLSSSIKCERPKRKCAVKNVKNARRWGFPPRW